MATNEPRERPRSNIRSRLRGIVAIAGTIGQLPGLALLATLFGLPRALVFCALCSLPMAVRIARNTMLAAEEHGLSGLAMLGFFTWWATSMLAACCYVPVWIGVHLAAALGALASTKLGPGVGFDATAAITLGLGAAGSLVGVTWNRVHVHLTRVEVPIANLAASLDGYRVVQLSDLHIGGHTPRSRVRAWVDRANALDADLAVVTGDLVTMGDDHLDAVAEELGRLRARDGVALCLGNHDYFCDTPRLVAALEGAGIEVLRNQGRVVDTGRGRYYLAGVDDVWTRRHDVAATLAERPAELPAIVLAHDPNLFDSLVEHGAQLVLSGHTHGGQVGLPLFAHTVNLARIAYRHSVGLYRRDDGSAAGAWHYVSRGAGTSGPPVRVGMPSELTLLTLRAA